MTPAELEKWHNLQDEGKIVRAAVIRFGYLRTAWMLAFFITVCLPYMWFRELHDWWKYRE